MSFSKLGYMIGGDLSALVSSALKLPPDEAMLVGKTIPHYLQGPGLSASRYPSCELTLFAARIGVDQNRPIAISLGFCSLPVTQESIDQNFVGLKLVALRFPGKQQSVIIKSDGPLSGNSNWGKRISKGIIIEEAHFGSFLLEVPYGIPLLLEVKGGVVTRIPDSEITSIPMYPYGCSKITSTPRTLGLMLKIMLGPTQDKNIKTRDLVVPLRVIGKPVNGSPEDEINAVALALKDSIKNISLGRLAGLCLIVELREGIHPILAPFFKKLRIIISPLVNSQCDILAWSRGGWIEVDQIRPILFFGSGCGLFSTEYSTSMTSEIKGFNPEGRPTIGDPILGERPKKKESNPITWLQKKSSKKE
ncbi:matrix [Sunshine Coast virus]|uniref:Matrix n=1 Tax=Sunshine Coast virus TaxID=1195087 RepID=I3VIZ0_9MONO|nr:matrix [Sunshine Coast virus]AFK79807.1 matrix [Sunshine Coast virus]